MEKQLSPLEIGKVFAMHLDGKVWVPLLNQSFLIAGIDLMNCTVNCADSHDAVDDSWMMFEDVKLLLTPLHAISDEDAIEVAKMAFYGKEGDSYDEVHTTNTTCKAGRRINLLGHRLFSIWLTKHGVGVAFVEIYYSHDRIGEIHLQVLYDNYFKINPVKNAAQINQFLFSKGYALPLYFGPGHPLNGRTAIECDLALDSSAISKAQSE